MTKNIFGRDNADYRLQILNNIFLIIGTPLFPVEDSRFYSVYRIITYMSLYFTFVTILIGIFLNLDDMAYVMESARPGISILNVLWTHFFMRYRPVCLWVHQICFIDSWTKICYCFYVSRNSWSCLKVVTRNLYHMSSFCW